MKQTKLIILNYSSSHEAVMNISKRPTRKCFDKLFEIIKKHTSITLSVGKYFDSCINLPNSFSQRFIDNNIDAKGQHFELLSFGSGRRICPGMYMGTTLVEFGLASLLYHFDWELPEGMVVEDVDMEEAPGLTVSKKSELLLVPVKYLDQ